MEFGCNAAKRVSVFDFVVRDTVYGVAAIQACFLRKVNLFAAVVDEFVGTISENNLLLVNVIRYAVGRQAE